MLLIKLEKVVFWVKFMTNKIEVKKYDKFKNIEFLRVILIFGIVMHHGFMKQDWSLYQMFHNVDCYSFLLKSFHFANNGVEAFFIISGFLFILTFKDTISFAKFFVKKYIRLCPVIFFATLLCYFASLFDLISFNWVDNILTILLLNNFVIRWSNGAVGSVWYVSALVTGLAIYFPIKKYIKNINIYYVSVALFVLLSYGTLEVLKSGSFGGPG